MLNTRTFSIFFTSIIVTILGLLLGILWGGFSSLLLILMLSTLEISLSFDNAVVNAKILQKMTPAWQRRFLTWGILIAVFGVRLLLPIYIVAVITGLGFIEVFRMAIDNPNNYAIHLEQAHISLASFGGMFLLMVFLSFVFDSQRSIHWLGLVERKMAQLGRLKSIEIIMALLVLLLAQSLAPKEETIHVFFAGIIGIILYVAIATLTDFMGKYQQQVRTGFIGFLYLEILDASFSFDGVMSAFAITKDIVLIIIGLTIGAIFVRSLTIFLVRKNTLAKYQYLEHGAHYAIGALAFIMLLGVSMEIPEMLTGLIGITLIGLAWLSSILYNRKNS